MTRGNCPSDDLLCRYASGELVPGEAETIEVHVGVCTHCLSRLDGLARQPDSLVSALRAPRATAPEVPPALARVVASVLGEERTQNVPAGPEPGTELCGYRITRELGRGGMGRVYRAVHPRL